MAELSSFRPFEPNGEQHPWHVIWDNIPCDQKGSVLHEHNLLYEVVLTVQCTFVPISASTFCPSHTSASKPLKTTCVSQRRRRRANRIHPLWSKIRRHATTTDDDPLSCRRRLSAKLLGRAFSHHFPLDLSLSLSLTPPWKCLLRRSGAYHTKSEATDKVEQYIHFTHPARLR